MARGSWPPTGRDLALIVLGVLSIALVYAYDTLDLSDRVRQWIVWADWALVAVFLLDWLDQARTAERRGRWVVRNAWLLLGMVPLAWGLGAFRFLRLARLARVLALTPALDGFARKARAVVTDGHIVALLATSAGITLAGSTLVWMAERGTNPDLASLGEAVWWGVVTVTTVGYGDITPVTTLGRTVAVALMVVGIGTIGLLASQVTGALVGRRDEDGGDAALETRLERLAALRREGMLTETEFDAAKAKLLA